MFLTIYPTAFEIPFYYYYFFQSHTTVYVMIC